MLGIIDVREWQAVIDLATAKPAVREAAFLKPLKKLAEKFPYPGDLEQNGIKWVTAAAEEIVNHYQPGWLFLSFTQPFFRGIYRPSSPEIKKDTAKLILEGIMDFARKHDFSPLIISSGDLIPLQGHIVIPGLKGILQSSSWSYKMAGVFKSESGDNELLNREPHIRSIVCRDDFINAYNLTDPLYLEYLPDYLLIAEDGWSFMGIFSHNRILYNIEKYNFTLPVYSEIGPVNHIEEVCGLMKAALEQGKKVLLALVEGLDENDFCLPYRRVNNCRDWYSYAGYNLYYTLVTGKPFYQHVLPPIYDHSIRRALPLRYPMSGPGNGAICEDSIGQKAGVPTAAVGSRSLVTHSIINADLTMECYTRAQANMGVLIAVNEERYNAQRPHL
jgi:hypothetical protein